jgi:hypothetical protein
LPSGQSTAAVGVVGVVAPSNKRKQTGNGQRITSQGASTAARISSAAYSAFFLAGDGASCCENKPISLDEQFCGP